MKITSSVFIAVLIGLAAPALAAEPTYKIVDRVKVPDGGFDYATVDSENGRVLIARTTFTTVIDTRSGKASQLMSAAHGHMAIAVPGTNLLVLPQGTGTVRIVDAAKDTVVADLPGGTGPDGAVYDPYTKFVFIMNHGGGDATVIDPVGAKVVGTIPIGGTLEFPVSDGAGKIFDNVTSVPEIAVIDAKTRTVSVRYKLDGCTGASGLAYDAQAKLLISSCSNGMAKVLQADTGKEIASLPIGRGPDAVFFDPIRKLAFVPCGGDGILEVISLVDLAHISVVQHVPTQVGSRTGTIDPKTGRIYLMASLPDTAAPLPPGGRGAPRLAGSYEVLVVGP